MFTQRISTVERRRLCEVICNNFYITGNLSDSVKFYSRYQRIHHRRHTTGYF